MKPAAFRYHAPKTIDEAVALLAEVAPEDGRILAGGQSLVPTMAFRLAKPGHLVDINNVAALKRLTVSDGKLCIGACVRHAAFHKPVCDGPRGAYARFQKASVRRAARQVPHLCGPLHRPLPDPQPRHVLRQPCLFRSVI